MIFIQAAEYIYGPRRSEKYSDVKNGKEAFALNSQADFEFS